MKFLVVIMTPVALACTVLWLMGCVGAFAAIFSEESQDIKIIASIAIAIFYFHLAILAYAAWVACFLRLRKQRAKSRERVQAIIEGSGRR